MRYAFGEFELDADSYQLRRAGAVVKLQPKVFGLLHYLIARRDRFIDKAELLQALWPQEHVTESSLFVCVRAALGQAHESNQPITMLRGQGYRFITPVEELPAHVAPRPAAAAVGGDAAKGSAVPAASNDPFVGREPVMQQLREALEQARAGHGRLLLITGEPGIGKTRCAEELAALARSHAIGVWTGRALEGAGAPAFWPWVQVLRQAVEQDAALAPEGRALLDVLLQRSSTDSQAAVPLQPEPPQLDRFWILDGVQRLLRAAAASAPRLIVIDDLQWADDASLRMLQLVAADLRGTACLIAVTLREPRVQAEPEREKQLRKLTRLADVIALPGLSARECDALVTALAGDRSPQLGQALHAKAGGNPLFLREMLRMVLRSGVTSELAQRGSSTALPPAVRDIVRGRIDELPAESARVLAAASVLGRELELPLLQRVLDVPGDALVGALDAAVQAKLIVAAEGSSRLAFGHDVVREVAYDGLDATTRLQLHLRAAQALAAHTGQPGRLNAIAYHFHCALPAGQHGNVLLYARKAGDAAMELFAFADAARFYTWALEALAFQPADAPRLRAELQLGLGTAQVALGDVDRGHKALRVAVELADEHGYAELLTLCGAMLRRVAPMAPIPDALALRAMERARELLAPDDTRNLVTVLSRLALLPPYSLDMERSKALSAQALAAARSTGSSHCLLEALDATLYSLTGPDDIDALLSTAAQVLSLEAQAKSSWSFAQAHFFRYHALLYRGDHQAADAALGDFGRAVSALPYPETLCFYERLCAQREFYQGKFALAQARYEDLHGRGRRLGMDYADLFYSLQVLALQHERQGLLAQPPQLSSFEHASWDLTGTASFEAVLIAGMLELGVRDEARRRFDELAKNRFAAVPRNLDYLYALCQLAEVACALEDRERSAQLQALLEPYALYDTPNLLSFCSGSVAHYLGLLAALQHDATRARARFELAIERNERFGYPFLTARSRYEYAKLLARTGEAAATKQALSLLAQAQHCAAELGLEPLQRQVQALAQTLPSQA